MFDIGDDKLIVGYLLRGVAVMSYYLSSNRRLMRSIHLRCITSLIPD